MFIYNGFKTPTANGVLETVEKERREVHVPSLSQSIITNTNVIPIVGSENVGTNIDHRSFDGKAVGLDKISLKLLCIGASALASQLTKIFNLLISTGIFPDEWKVARVVPIHKNGSLQATGNFRPVSILSTLSKLLEKHVHIAFYSFLKKMHLAQSGSRNLFSCEIAIINVVDKWTKATENDLMNGVILLDVRKAFDLTDHELLIQTFSL